MLTKFFFFFYIWCWIWIYQLLPIPNLIKLGIGNLINLITYAFSISKELALCEQSKGPNSPVWQILFQKFSR